MTVPVTDVSNSIKVSGFDQSIASKALSRNPTPYRTYFKRLLDVTVVVASAVFVLPLVLTLAGIIWLKGGQPFYSQTRVGRGGRTFRIYKLRTMVPNADAILAKRLEESPALRAEWEATQKLKCDPRITTFGRVLRKTSLDELPQLLNVLRGEMSLVGPRPMMDTQVSLYPGSAYYRLRPGLTGFWQISDRNQCDFADRARFDEAYDRSLSLGTDLRVLASTVGVVLRGTGY
jgi:lipopolysaccharide/colanic/teichoic acid biosynthesis glycosyltransferase